MLLIISADFLDRELIDKKVDEELAAAFLRCYPDF